MPKYFFFGGREYRSIFWGGGGYQIIFFLEESHGFPGKQNQSSLTGY